MLTVDRKNMRISRGCLVALVPLSWLGLWVGFWFLVSLHTAGGGFLLKLAVSLLQALHVVALLFGLVAQPLALLTFGAWLDKRSFYPRLRAWTVRLLIAPWFSILLIVLFTTVTAPWRS